MTATVSESSSASAQPSRAPRSTSTSSEVKSRPFTRTPPPSSCSNSPARSAARIATELLAELWSEHWEIRLHAQLGRLDRAELDFLYTELLRDLAGMALRRACALHDEPTEWLSQLQSCVAASLTAELDDPPHLRDLSEQTVVRFDAPPAKAAETPTRARHRARSVRQRKSARNGITGAITCTERTSACHSVHNATSSPSQNRRRERRMYQFDRSSTNDSNDRISAGVQ